jgi:hypothetical protein
VRWNGLAVAMLERTPGVEPRGFVGSLRLGKAWQPRLNYSSDVD